MKRSEFLTLIAALVPMTSVLSQTYDGDYSLDEITGLKRPPLFGDNYNLRKLASEAYGDMRADALKEGVKLYSQSSYRDYNHQNRIWTRKYNMYTNMGMKPLDAIAKIILWSTIPGTSRHHWGTDLDIIDRAVPAPSDLLSPEHFRVGGRFEALHVWMTENASKYGFYLAYTNAEERKGFNYEPWHFSFRELSKPMLTQIVSVDFFKIWSANNLNGRSYLSKELVEQYIAENLMSINPALK